MGTDIHGPWVERVWTDPNGIERASCIAEIQAFDRDYAAFGLIASGSRYHYDEGIEPRGIPPGEPSHQWTRHMMEDVKLGMEYAARRHEEHPDIFPAVDPWDWRRAWREEWWRNRDEFRNCYGHSWVTTDEIEQAQRHYIAYYEKWRDEEPETFADRGVHPFPGFQLALAVMREAESVYGQPCRLVFCFDC